MLERKLPYTRQTDSAVRRFGFLLGPVFGSDSQQASVSAGPVPLPGLTALVSLLLGQQARPAEHRGANHPTLAGRHLAQLVLQPQ